MFCHAKRTIVSCHKQYRRQFGQQFINIDCFLFRTHWLPATWVTVIFTVHVSSCWRMCATLYRSRAVWCWSWRYAVWSVWGISAHLACFKQAAMVYHKQEDGEALCLLSTAFILSGNPLTNNLRLWFPLLCQITYICLQFSVPQIEYPLRGSGKIGSHVYFLLIVAMVLLLWYHCTIVTSGHHGSIRITFLTKQ